MPTLTIRHVDPSIKRRLRLRAAGHGRSLAAELRHILSEAADGRQRAEVDPAKAIRRRFQPFGGVADLPAHPPVMPRDAAAFER